MSDESNDLSKTGDGATNTSDSPPSGPAGGGTESEFKWGAGAPADWQGKGPEYALSRYNELVSGFQSYVAQAQAAAATPPPRHEPTEPLDPDLVVTDPAKWQNALSQRIATYVDSTVRAATAPAYLASTEAAKALSQTDPAVKSHWQMFGPQIDALAANPAIPSQARASKAFWDNAARVVAAEPANMERIVQERVNSKIATLGSGVERGGPSRGASDPEPTALEALKATAYGKRLAERYSDRELARFVEQSGETIKSFTAKAKATHIEVNRDNPGEWASHHLGVARDVAKG